MKNKSLEMGTEPIGKLLFKYSSTLFCSLLFSALYNAVDAVFISYGVGDLAMAGVSVASPFMMIQAAFAQMLGGGAGVLVTGFLGKKEYEKAGDVTFNTMAVFYSTAITVSLISILFCTPILRVFGATDEIMPYAREYFIVIAAGNVFSTGFSSIIRAEGRMKYSLLIWLIPTGINILFDYIFVFVLKLGVVGAALATVLCQFTSFLMSVIFFLKISCQKIKIKLPDFSIVKNVLGLGVPALLQTGGMSVVMFAINNRLSHFDDAASIASFAYISKIIQFSLVPINAVSMALSPIISYNFASGEYSRVKKAIKSALGASCGFCVAELLAGFFLGEHLISVFSKSPEILNKGNEIIRILSLSLILVPFILIAATCFQATANKKKSVCLNAVLIVSTSLCVFTLSFAKGNVMWWGVLLGCVFSFLLCVLLIEKEKKNRRPD